MCGKAQKFKTWRRTVTNRAIVISADENSAQVMALPKGSCSTAEHTGCADCGGCSGKAVTFRVQNPLKLQIKKGTIVKIEASKKAQAVQGLLSLLIPFACAVTGYFLAPKLMSLLGKPANDDSRAFFVLLFLFLSAAIVFTVSRKIPLPGQPQITDIEE